MRVAVEHLVERLQWFLFSVLATASIGALWTAALAWIQIRDNGYLAQGLPNNAIRTLLNATPDGALYGALVGAVLFAVAVALRFLWRAAKLDHAAGSLPCFLYVSFSLIVIGARAASHGAASAKQIWAVLLLAALWCCLFVSKRWPFVVRHPNVSLFVTTHLCLVPALTLLLRSEHVRLLSRPETVLAAIATYAACFVTLGRLSKADAGAGPRTLWLLAVPAFLLLLALMVLPVALEPKLSRPTNVLLIGIDTLRLDHTSLLDGSSRETSPNLGVLAARGTLFKNAISQAPWTLPAFASVMTGRYPREHGAISLSGYLRPTEITMAERLREAGFDTAGIVSNTWVDSAHGFAQGFDVFDDTHASGRNAVTSVDVTELALDYLGKPRSKPFFLFVHYFDPHNEYQDHADFAYADGYQGWLRQSRFSINGLRDRRHDLSRADLGYLRDLYDEEIAFTDSQIGRVLSYLKETGLDRSTMVIVVADHGEEFMERGWLGHTTSLHEELIRVPLIIALPPAESQVPTVATPVETRAVLATVLDFLKLDQAGDMTRGSLLPLIRAEPQEASETSAFSEVWLPDSGIDKRLRMSSLRTDRWKFTKNFTRNEEHLYNLAEDAGEHTNLIDSETEKAQELRARLETWLQAMDGLAGETATIEMTDEQIRELRALGYVK